MRETVEKIVKERVLPEVSKVRRGWVEVGRGADGTPTMRVDEIAEREFLRGLEEEGVDARVISEESGEMRVGEAPEVTLVLDPLDGSHNASRGLPFYCVSVGIADPEAETLDDVEEGLVISELLTFGPGDVEEKPVVERPLVSAYYYGSDRMPVEFSRGRFKLRCLGAVALELALVGKGALDGFVDVRGSLRPTDVAGAFGAARGELAFIFARSGRELDPSEIPLRPDFRFELATARSEDEARELFEALKEDVGVRVVQCLFGKHPEGLSEHTLCGKLGEECCELAHAVGKGEGYGEELADVFALVMNLANELDVDVLTELRRKFRRVFECSDRRSSV
ncbi:MULTISPECIES: inositol monophosphatase family protein [unclassified Methanopyrus]|uniref:inositol monophosphatase family protein n=1 Tax=Methanopyrus sp. SNP6 TaxID=1937005 RepID=UPI0011E5C059|nr:inositol monophosphatase family protein [Methanopyrus sp. SNP6]